MILTGQMLKKNSNNLIAPPQTSSIASKETNMNINLGDPRWLIDEAETQAW